ncbi:MAG TPA: hypothetical protein VF303_04770 [Candidatus Nanoarchaeia archaeon]
MDAEIPVSPEELEIPTDDLEKPTQETPKQPDQDSDNKSSVILAEDIAQFRTDLEQKIFFDRLPRSEWRKAYEETLTAHPEIRSYKDIFNAVMKAAENANDDLETVWNQHHTQEGQPVGEPTHPDEASKLFKSMFGLELQNESRTSKSAISLYFYVSDDDFRGINKLAGKEDNLEENAFVIEPTINRRFPVAVLRKGLSDEESWYTGAHEFEHIKSKLIGKGRLYFRNRPFFERLAMPTAIAQRLEKRDKSSSSMENGAKEEILAYFTEPEGFSPTNPPSKVIQFSEEWGEELKRLLATEEWYLSRYREMFKPTPEQEKAYLVNVRKGTDSMVQLFNFYFSIDKDTRKAARMAINVLEQFPLHSWPAVVRLINQRHQKTE